MSSCEGITNYYDVHGDAVPLLGISLLRITASICGKGNKVPLSMQGAGSDGAPNYVTGNNDLIKGCSGG